jgi:ParB family chromosome partitioning protein
MIKVESVEINKLHKQSRNPNSMGEAEMAALRASIEEYGFLQPILVRSREDGFEIVDGHHRRDVMASMGATTIPAVVVDNLSRRQIDMLQLAMNKNRGSLQLDVVEAIFRDLMEDGLSDRELLATGYSDEDVNRLLKLSAADTAPVKAGGASSDMELPSRPVSLEIPMESAEQLRIVKDKLKKASGKASDVTVGLLNLLGMIE